MGQTNKINENTTTNRGPAVDSFFYQASLKQSLMETGRQDGKNSTIFSIACGVKFQNRQDFKCLLAIGELLPGDD